MVMVATTPLCNRGFYGTSNNWHQYQSRRSLRPFANIHQENLEAPQRTPLRLSGVEQGRNKVAIGATVSTGKRTLLGTGFALGVLAVGMAGGVESAQAGLFGPSSGDLVQSGMQKFRKGDVEGSLSDFDAILDIAPSQKPYLWQRGLSLYYANSICRRRVARQGTQMRCARITCFRFEDGAKQFRDDVAVNPNDTEESIWAYLCEAQLKGADSAQQTMLKVGRDSRPVMRAAYELFRGSGTLQQWVSSNGFMVAV
eukprot:1181871-Prorocentrum_minimum.AAC.4